MLSSQLFRLRIEYNLASGNPPNFPQFSPFSHLVVTIQNSVPPGGPWFNLVSMAISYPVAGDSKFMILRSRFLFVVAPFQIFVFQFEMTASKKRGIFKTFMSAERKESSTRMSNNIFPRIGTGPFDCLMEIDLQKNANRKKNLSPKVGTLFTLTVKRGLESDVLRGSQLRGCLILFDFRIFCQM